MVSVMYRTEAVYGSGVRDIVAVIYYEVFELGNTDILSYVAQKYPSAFSRPWHCQIKQLIEAVDSRDCSGASEEHNIQFCEELAELLRKYFNVDLKFCLWLASRETVMQYYGADDDSVIDAYRTSEYVLSDLGEQGVLFAYTDMPEPVVN